MAAWRPLYWPCSRRGGTRRSATGSTRCRGSRAGSCSSPRSRRRVTSRADAPAAGLRRDLLGLSLGASVATLAITAALFFVIPRIGQAALTLRTHTSRMVTGFSDRVELGSFGQIETDDAIAMRVHIPEQAAGELERRPGLRWRGVALDTYDGHEIGRAHA